MFLFINTPPLLVDVRRLPLRSRDHPSRTLVSTKRLVVQCAAPAPAAVQGRRTVAALCRPVSPPCISVWFFPPSQKDPLPLTETLGATAAVGWRPCNPRLLDVRRRYRPPDRTAVRPLNPPVLLLNSILHRLFLRTDVTALARHSFLPPLLPSRAQAYQPPTLFTLHHQHNV